jgi:hypothetical protein
MDGKLIDLKTTAQYLTNCHQFVMREWPTDRIAILL